MPKQADIRVSVPNCTAALFWDIVYERPEATERYHTSYNASTSTSVTPWSACSRTVRFTMPLRMPDFVKRLVGLESVAVTEVQRVLWHGGGAFSVTSETSVGGMGAGRFTTALQLTVTELGPTEWPVSGAKSGRTAAPVQPAQPLRSSNDADAGAGAGDGSAAAATSMSGRRGGEGGCGGVQLVYSVRCGASSVPWPMAATIENLMAEKALVSMQTFLDFCTQLLDEHAAAEATAADGAGASTTGSGAAEAGALCGPALPTTAGGAGGAGSTSDGSGGLPPLPSAACNQRAPALRHRWPSITCSHDIGGGAAGSTGGAGTDPWVAAGGTTAACVSGGDAFFLRRQDTAGPAADVFWDAPESFACTGVNGGSGPSSGLTSPRHQGQAGALRHLPLDQAAAHSGGLTASGLFPGGSCGGGGAPSAFAAAAAAVEAQSVAAAVDRLTQAVAMLDRKLDKVILLQQTQEVAAAGRRRGDGGSKGANWLLRIAIALLAATLLTVGFWALHPHATGLRPSPASAGGATVRQAGSPSSPQLPALLFPQSEGAAEGAHGLGAADVSVRRLLRGGGFDTSMFPDPGRRRGGRGYSR